MSSKPKLFIGSASESLEFANALEFELQNDATTEVWNRAFRPGHYTLEELTRKAAEVDLAVFILGQEDKTESRGKIVLSPRDNVVYEAGLFGGHCDVSRVLFLVDARGTKIPTDWDGIGYLTYDPSSETPKDAIRQAAVRIRERLSEWKNSGAASVEQQISGRWWQFVVSADSGSVVSYLSIVRIASNVEGWRWTVKGDSWTHEGKPIAQYWSRATALDERDRKLFYYWEGRHPFNKSIPAFFGVGEIEFDEAHRGSISKATGWFSSSPLSSLNETVRKSVRYVRASNTDVQVMEGGEQVALERLVKTRLDERQTMKGTSSSVGADVSHQ